METSWLKRNIPILTWLPAYNRSWLTADAIAGLTVWGLVVPESMAYAGVAGLPPQFGLYTLAVSLLVYALLGSSRHLFVQPTSATAALIASSVTAVLVATGIAASTGEVDPLVYAQYAGAFTIVVGIVFLAASLARLGFITQFLSKPVLDGFVTGLAVYVMVGQLNKLFGVEKPAGNTVQKFFGILRELPESNWVALALGVVAMVLINADPTLEQEDTSRADRPVWLDYPELGFDVERQLRSPCRRRAATRSAVFQFARRANPSASAHARSGDRGLAGLLQPVAGCCQGILR